MTVILNSPDLGLFDPARPPTRKFMADGRLRIVYTGALTPTYELDVSCALWRRSPAFAPSCR